MYRCTQVTKKYIAIHSWRKEREKEREEESDLVQAAHRHNPYGKRDKGYGHVKARQMAGRQGPNGQAETFTWWAYRPQQASRDPHLAGRDPHPLGHQPGHQGERASVKETSRHTRDATNVSRMHGNHKRAIWFSQLKQMEGKICSSTRNMQECQ